MYSFSIVAITNDHQFGGLYQHEWCNYLTVCRSEVWVGLAGFTRLTSRYWLAELLERMQGILFRAHSSCWPGPVPCGYRAEVPRASSQFLRPPPSSGHHWWVLFLMHICCCTSPTPFSRLLSPGSSPQSEEVLCFQGFLWLEWARLIFQDNTFILRSVILITSPKSLLPYNIEFSGVLGVGALTFSGEEGGGEEGGGEADEKSPLLVYITTWCEGEI